ncbi:CAF17-like 4Fe-4S cluster assembly/insertion protein YgfZ [Kordiimonas pumila]|uniref:YgfZ/GcvT domain-containing protein n=1 Tax=Kordiimonas pumila TaxID=2161677 RepID=A0ABV7D896_9PROT|nr:folate-binding protein YgfZ [Kordiimonas pumila]
MTAQILCLKNRAVLRLSGSEVVSFLNGLVTNDVGKTSEAAVYAALLTPQGKFLFDMIIVKDGVDLLLDVEAKRKDALIQRLMMYKLRSDVTITDEPASVWAVWHSETAQGISGIAYADPRHKSLKLRVISATPPVDGAEELPLEDYEERRIRHCVPDSTRDIDVEKHFWLETNAEKLNGVSFTKGCYVGQELTARMKHKTTLKKSFMAVELTGTAEPHSEIETESGKSAGTLYTSMNGYGIAFMRHEYQNAILYVKDSDVRVTIYKKD